MLATNLLGRQMIFDDDGSIGEITVVTEDTVWAEITNLVKSDKPAGWKLGELRGTSLSLIKLIPLHTPHDS